MKLPPGTEQKTLSLDNNGQTETVPLYSDRSFDLISEQWLRVGWNQRYSYTFSWMGGPFIQLPEDIVRI
jgi:cephalosporin hydroxylase